MALRSTGSATVSFGLVSIPVKLYTAVESGSAVSFNLLAKDGNRVKQQYVNAATGEVVERADMIKGYEFEKGQFVTFTKEELEALEAESTQAIEIEEFVPLASVDPMFFEKSYLVAPDKGAAKGYALLRAAMEKAGKAALARYAARGKDYLVLLRAVPGGIVMQQVYYAEEVRSFSLLEIEPGTVKDGEVALALQLIEQTSNPTFQPEKYHDGVRARMLDAIEKKKLGESVAVAAPAIAKSQVIDLAEALKASLSVGKAPAKAPAAAPAPAPAAEPVKAKGKGKGKAKAS